VALLAQQRAHGDADQPGTAGDENAHRYSAGTSGRKNDFPAT
jgi:hypothetical protein